MKRFITPIILIIPFLFLSCGKKKKEAAEETAQEITTAQMCSYAYDNRSTIFAWKAFKTNEKIGVGGTFDTINVTSTTANSLKDLIKTIKFDIPTSSVNSNNPDRDKKIFEFFFGKMEGGNKISGQVKKVSGNENSGIITLFIMMNSVGNDVEMTYDFSRNILNMEGEINLGDFNGQEAVKSLNDKCHDLHTGKDGVSILWPDVKLTLTTTIDKVCE